MKAAFSCLALLLLLPAAAWAEEPWVDPAWVDESSRQYFAVSVGDMDRSVAWYGRALGLDVLDDTSADDGRWRIVNMLNDHLSVELIQDRRDAVVDRARGFAKVGFMVSDVAAVADRVERSGETRPRVLDFQKHQIRLIQLKDPDDNIVQLFSPLAEPETDQEPEPGTQTMTITRINHFTAKPESADELHALIESFLPMIRDSDGCIEARLMRDTDHPEKIVVVEVWRDKEAHRASAANVPPGTFEKAMTLMAGPPQGAYYQ